MIAAKNILAVIFDCDGVMFDSRQANIKYYNRILAHFSLPPMTQEEETFVYMHTADESVRYIFRKTPFLKEANAHRKKMSYSPFIKDMVIEPGLKELLTDIRPRFGLAVATNRSNTIGEVLSTHGLNDYFDIVVSSLDVKNPKPDPESLFKILDFFEIRPDQALYVGDSRVDLDLCLAARVPLIAYKNKALRANIHVKGMKQLKKILDSPGTSRF
ncbi:MAG: HAD hydrolase-like protein [Thermodesulfobacteriota bacterium]|nr:HAD hydrolase-like protein [Thermodesulfobacteriota bacterium]